MNLPKGIAHYIEHNDHKTIYQPVRAYLYDNKIGEKDMPPSEYEEVIATDELWVVRWYPHTPVGFCIVAASTLEKALEWANKP